jgi:hypothetical protein
MDDSKLRERVMRERIWLRATAIARAKSLVDVARAEGMVVPTVEPSPVLSPDERKTLLGMLRECGKNLGGGGNVEWSRTAGD